MTAKGPTLTDAKGMGGIIAQDGFDYQVWDALARLPAWLRNPAFEGMMFEGLEDYEARFFSPHALHRHFLDRFQAKSGLLQQAALRDVFKSFEAFDLAHPKVARVQTLVTPTLPTGLTWIARDPGRVRRARPFYSPFADIQAASDDKLRDDLIDQFGTDLGGFFSASVEISLMTWNDHAHANIGFAMAMAKAFPDIDIIPRLSAKAFDALNQLAAQTRGVMLTRDRLLAALSEELAVNLIPDARLPLHIRSDRNNSQENTIEIDASAFSGGENSFPEPEIWKNELIAPLNAVARWAQAHRQQRIALSGSFRISTALSLGWSFRSATGFEIDIPTRSGEWATDDRSAVGNGSPTWQIIDPETLHKGRLIVAIGVMRDPCPAIRTTLGLQSNATLLSCYLADALTDGAQAHNSVNTIKAAVTRAVAQFAPTAIDLYFVGPAAFAVALGHRWNALPPTQLYEYAAANGRYIPTTLLE